MTARQLKTNLLCFSTVISFALLLLQVCNAQDKGCSYINRTKPSVFLSLVSQKKKKSKKDTEQVVLRLTNNSSCFLIVETGDLIVMPEYGKYWKEESIKGLPNGQSQVRRILDIPDDIPIPVYYDIGTKKGYKPANYWGGRHLVFFQTIAPGRTVTFPIKAEHFRKRYGISVLFNYEWENNEDLRFQGVIQHRVWYMYELPDGYYKPQ